MQIEKGAEPDTSHISTGLAALGESTIERADEIVRGAFYFLQMKVYSLKVYRV